MTREMRWLLAFLIPLIVVVVAHGVGDSTHNPLPLVLVALVAALLSIIYPCVAFGRLAWRLLRGRPLRPLATGTELIVWLMSVLATVVVVVPLYANVGSRARLAKAQFDTRALASSISRYHEHTGRLPETLDDLTRRVANAKGQEVGPFMEAIPSPNAGWSPYRYERRPDGTFSVHSRGDEGEVRAP